MVWVIARDNCDTPLTRRNLKSASGLGGLSKVIPTEGVTPTVAGMFYQVVVAAVLLYDSKMWCLTESARYSLDNVHVNVVQWITGMQPRKVKRQGKDEWV